MNVNKIRRLAASLIDNVKIKNSTLEKVEFSGVEVYKDCILTAERIKIEDYSTFKKNVKTNSTNFVKNF